MSLAKRLTDLANSNNIHPWEPTQAVTLHRHPQGWEPGVVWNGNTGTAVSRPRVADQEADHAELLKEWGFDPKTHHVVGDLEYRQWDASVDGVVTPMRYYKARISQGTSMPSADLDALKEEIRGWGGKPQVTRPVDEETEDALCVFLADFQIGKGEGGGSAKTVERLLDAGESLVQRVLDLRSLGRRVDTLYVFGLGDLLEGCTGYYPMQEFQTDLNRRDQFQVVVRVILSLLRRWSPLFERVVVTGIAGNHGENRRNGRAFTDFADNDDVAVFETIAMICNENSIFDHVSFVIPHDRLSLTLNVAGQIVGITHGHQMRAGGKLAQAKAQEYWKQQSFGNQPLKDATILVSGHFHHFSAIEMSLGRTHFQAPAMDGGSRWFTEISGVESSAGMLSFRVDRTGWSDLAILRSAS